MEDKSKFDYRQLDEIIHSRIRLSVMSILIGIKEAEFTLLRNQVKTTDGNLSIHLRKLEDAGYIAVTKSFLNRKPMSTYKLTAKGREAFKAYVDRLENIIKA